MLRVVEIIAGIYYLIFGIDGFFKKIPLPVPSEKALRFLQALDESKYILFTVKIIEILVGLAWIAGRGTGLAWVLLTPIWFNIIAYHVVLNKKEVWMPLGLFLVHIVLAYKNYTFLVMVFGLEFTL